VSNARNDGAQLIDPWQEGQSTPSLRFDEPVTSQLPFDEPGSSRLPFDEAGTPQLPFDEPARPPDDRDA
jgi:hypothetical protein